MTTASLMKSVGVASTIPSFAVTLTLISIPFILGLTVFYTTVLSPAAKRNLPSTLLLASGNSDKYFSNHNLNQPGNKNLGFWAQYCKIRVLLRQAVSGEDCKHARKSRAWRPHDYAGRCSICPGQSQPVQIGNGIEPLVPSGQIAGHESQAKLSKFKQQRLNDEFYPWHRRCRSLR